MRRQLLSLLVLAAATLPPFLAAPPASAATVVQVSHDLPLSSYADHVVDLERERIYLSPGLGDDRLAVTDLQGAPVASRAGLTGASALALSGDKSSLFVALETGRIVELDPVTLSEKATHAVSGDEPVLDLAWAGGRLWLLRGHGAYDLNLSVLDPGSGTVTPTDVGVRGTTLAVGEDRVLALGSAEPSVLALGRDGSVVDRRVLGDYPDRITNSATGQVILTRSYSEAGMVVLDPATLQNVRTTRISSNQATTDGVLAAAKSYSSPWHAVTVVDAATSELRNTFRVPSDPQTADPSVADLLLTPRGLVLVSTSADGVSTWFEPEPGVTGSTVTLEFPDQAWVGKEVTLTGTLTDAGEAVSGAQVTITDTLRFTDDEPARSRTVTTAADGTFSFPYTPRGWAEDFHVRYPGDEGHPPSEDTFSRSFDHQPTELRLDYPPTPAPGEPVTIRGLLTALGEPVADAELDVDQYCASERTVRTDADGTFDLVVTPGRCAEDRFTFSYAGDWTYRSLWTSRTIRPTWGTSQVTLSQPVADAVVGSRFSWTGTVTSAGGPVPGVPVSWSIRRSSTGASVADGTTETDAAGGFAVSRAINHADHYTMTVRYLGDATTLGSSASDPVVVTRIPTTVTLDDTDIESLPDAEITISGRVVTPEGAAVAGHPLRIWHEGEVTARAITDAEGRFEHVTVPRPPQSWADDGRRYYGVEVVQSSRYAEAQATVRVVVAPEATRLVLRRVPTPTMPGDQITLGGRLTTSSGEPLADRSVMITHQDGDESRWELTTDESGRFAVDTVIRTGRWQQARASFAGTRLLAAVSDSQEWTSNPLPGVLTLETVGTRVLGESVPIRGRLTDTEGRGDSSWITISRVNETGHTEWTYAQVQTADDGTFALEVPAESVGRFTYVARSSTWRVAAQTASIPVDVRQLQLTTTAQSPDVSKDGWAVYDAARDPRLLTRTEPRRAGLCIGHEVQRRVDGRWRAPTTMPCRESDSAGEVRSRLTPRHPAGSRFRVRPVREGATRTEGDWVLVRFR